MLQANEQNPGAIPTYKWEVVPAEAGDFDPADEAVTEFTAQEVGEARIRLTAADGVFQTTAECTLTVIEVGDVSVELSVTPAAPAVGESATLQCVSTGETVTATRTIEQTGGVTLELNFEAEGVATFTATDAGDYTFSCVGVSPGGIVSEPTTLQVTVPAPSSGDGGDDNSNDNGNSNSGGRPGRPRGG
jgi:hypothetical protein